MEVEIHGSGAVAESMDKLRYGIVCGCGEMFGNHKTYDALVGLTQMSGGCCPYRRQHHRRCALNIDIVSMIAHQLLVVQIDNLALSNNI